MVIFRENHKNDNKGEFQNFCELTLNMNFANLPKIGILEMALFGKFAKFIYWVNPYKSRNSPSSHFYDFPSKRTIQAYK